MQCQDVCCFRFKPSASLREMILTVGPRYNRYLRDLIISGMFKDAAPCCYIVISSANSISTGKAKPSFVVSHEVSMDETPEAYVKFDKVSSNASDASILPRTSLIVYQQRIEGYTKVLIHPNGPL